MICETCHGRGMLGSGTPIPCPQCGGCGTDYCCGPSGSPDWSWASGYFVVSEVEKRALEFATAAHGAINQKRKYSGEDYIVHPIVVAEIVRSVRHTPNMIAAALLHDTVEDTPIELSDINDEFGYDIAELVYWLTDVSKQSDGNRAKRKQMDLEHIAKAPAAAKTIKLADLIDNTISIREHDPDFWRVYRHEKLRMLEVLKAGDQTLWAKAASQCA